MRPPIRYFCSDCEDNSTINRNKLNSPEWDINLMNQILFLAHAVLKNYTGLEMQIE